MATACEPSHVQQPFSAVTQNLRRLGGFPIDHLISCPGIEFEAFDLPFFASYIDVPTTLSMQEPDIAAAVAQENLSSSMRNMLQLRQTCLQTFGTSDGLKFEFLEEYGADREFLAQVQMFALCSHCHVFLRGFTFTFFLLSLAFIALGCPVTFLSNAVELHLKGL